MQKIIDFNTNSLEAQIKIFLPYLWLVILGIGAFEYFYFYKQEMLLILLTHEDLASMQQMILMSGKILLCLILVLYGLFLIVRCLHYIYVYFRCGVTFKDWKAFHSKVRQLQGLKVTLKRIRANIDDEFPLISLEKKQNSYILSVYKNHWFSRDQVETNTDFFKSVIKLPLYKIEEDFDKITLVFTAEEKFLNYKQFLTFFEQGKILMGYDENEQPIFWEFNIVPHLLGVGTTGSGKSNFMKILIDSIVPMGAKIYFADGKRVELVRYQFMGYDVATDNFLRLFEQVHTAMMSRYAKMEKESIERQEEVNHYTKLSFDAPPIFLIIDEWASITDNLDREVKDGASESDYKRAVRLIKDILQLGRAGGVQVIAFMQDPKATTLDTSLRNNFNMRVLLGAVKEKTAYDMLFGSEYRHLEPQKTGGGYFMGADEPKVFKIPLWEEQKITVEKV